MPKRFVVKESGPIGYDEKTQSSRAVGGIRAGRMEQMNADSGGLVDLLEPLPESKKVYILNQLKNSGIDPKDVEARIEFVRRLLDK